MKSKANQSEGKGTKSSTPKRSNTRNSDAGNFKAVKSDPGKSMTVKEHRAAGTTREAEGSSYRDAMAAAIHEGLAGLVSIGALANTAVREFDQVLLTSPIHFTGEMVKALRTRENVTQSVLAHHLGVSINTISQWERGERQVTGTAAKLLSLVEKHGLSYIL